MLATIRETVIAIILGFILSIGLTSMGAQAKDNITSSNNVHTNNKHSQSNGTQYYEIDFTYNNIINSKSYREEAVLLRDKSWLNSNHIHKAGDTLVLNIPEFGVVNAKATARSVELSNANPEAVYSKQQSMVTATFKHYSTDVREYTLQDSKTSITQTIQATPNHAFYVQNRTAYNKALNQQSHFIQIQHITPEDHMLNEAGNSVELVCGIKLYSSNKRTTRDKASNTINKGSSEIALTNGNTTNCYKQLVQHNKPIAVYNLEIYKQHQYLVLSNNSIMQDNGITNTKVNGEEDSNNISNNDVNNNLSTTNNSNNSIITKNNDTNHLTLAINNALLVHNVYGDAQAETSEKSSDKLSAENFTTGTHYDKAYAPEENQKLLGQSRLPEAKIVYRGTKDAPEKAFKEGLKAYNPQNIDLSLVKHQFNIENSPYISSSTDPYVAFGFAENDGYLYRIVAAPENSYDLSLLEDRRLNIHPHEQEVSIYQYVDKENIIDVINISEFTSTNIFKPIPNNNFTNTWNIIIPTWTGLE